MEVDHSFQLGNDDEYISVTLREVLGVPDEIAYGGGYNCKATVNISAGWFRAQGDIWVTTGEVYRFYQGLRCCFERLDGEVQFVNEYDDLDFACTFSPKRGHVTVKGQCRELLGSSLNFVLELDQSYIPQTLRQLARIVAEFGDDKGVPRH